MLPTRTRFSNDYNVTLEHKKDTCGNLHINNPTFRQFKKTCMATNNVTDVWRERNSEKREYTIDKQKTRNWTN